MQKNKVLMNTILYLSIIITLISIISVFVSAKVDIKTHPYWQDFGDTLLDNIPFFGGDYLYEDRGSTLMSFYPVEDWEIEVCNKDISPQRPQGSTPAAMDSTSLWYNDVALAITATKYDYSSNNTLYYLDWYAQSYTILENDLQFKYSLYLKTNGGTKFYLDGYKKIPLEPFQGSVGAFSKYYDVNYTKAGIEYFKTDSEILYFVETPIVYDKTVIYEAQTTN